MATPLAVASGETDRLEALGSVESTLHPRSSGGAGTWSHPPKTTHDTEIQRIGIVVKSPNFSSNSNLECWAGIFGAGIVWHVAYVAKVAREDRETPSSSGLGIVVMTLILDYKSQIVVTSEIHGQLDLCHRCRIDNVGRITSHRAVTVRGVEWQTCAALVEREAGAHWVVDSMRCKKLRGVRK